VRIRSIRQIAAAVRGRRGDLGLSQADLAKRANVSRKWIYEFEAGKSTAEFGLLLQVLDALDLTLELSRLDDSATGETVDLDALLDEHRAK
jgi:HTH-type transcriptional regulator / antitoxin HipB